jgi:phage N-6-adenine-methyltransferase
MGLAHGALRKESRQNWRTPPELFHGISKHFGPFEVDLAADKDNALCARFFTEEDDAFKQVWKGMCFLNPPFNDIMPWVSKAYLSGGPYTTVVMLAPAAVGTKWFNHAMKRSRVFFFDRRVQFIHPVTGLPGKAPAGGHALFVFRKGVDVGPSKHMLCGRTGSWV